MDNGAKGVEIVISGKIRAARAKAMIFRDGYMIKSGDAVNHYVDHAVRNLELKQGVLGISVKIQLPHDPTGREGIATKLPDVVTVREPKEETFNKFTAPHAQNVHQSAPPAAAPVSAAAATEQQQPQQQQAVAAQ